VIAAMASILFRMRNSFTMKRVGLRRHANWQFIARGIVPSKMSLSLPQFSTFLVGRGTLGRRPASAILAPVQRVECSYRFHPRNPPQKTHSGDISMTITAAHIPAIVALIAGVLILIMPRLLNFVVAIYLILTGLIGLGLLRMFHL
jgi:hypothetical protein